MRSSFGKRAEVARVNRGMSLDAFAKEMGVSHARVSQLEHGKAKISDITIDRYVEILGLQPADAEELQAEAHFSNNRLLFKQKDIVDDRFLALYTTYGAVLPEELKAEITKLVEQEVERQGLNIDRKHKGKMPSPSSIKSLARASISTPKPRSARKHSKPKTSLSPARFVDLLLISETVRSEYLQRSSRFRVDLFLEDVSSRDPFFDIEIVEIMPQFAGDAYAVTTGTSEGHVVVIEEGFYKKCADGNYFFRHVLLHEYSHHLLHGELLETNSECYLEPHPLSFFSGNADAASEVPLAKREFTGDAARRYSIPNTVELEAEYLAVMLALPWIRIADVATLSKNIGNDAAGLARQYGTIQGLVVKAARFLSVESIRDQIKQELFDRGHKKHPFFSSGRAK